MRVFFGDSITHGVGHVDSQVNSFAALLGGVNAGVPGMMVAKLLHDWEQCARPYLAPNQHVHVLLGTNDSLFGQADGPTWEANIRALVARLATDGRRVFVSAPYYAPSWPASNPLVSDYTQRAVVMWNDPACAAEPGALFVFNPPELADLIHPSAAGHLHMRDVLASKLPAN